MSGVLDRFKKELSAMTKRIDSLNSALAPVAVGMVQDNMTNGNYADNAPLTKSLKNEGSRPLINTGETRASITFKLVGDGFVIGTNKKYAPILNAGGTITAKNARMLMLPATKDVKKRMDAWGVKQTLSWLENSGWKLFWRPGALIGQAPKGARAFGKPISLKLKGKAKQKRHSFYLICYRKKSINIPKREFMQITTEQMKTLKALARQHVTGKNNDRH